jgi:exopolysaccharide production protein ExoY
MASYDPRLNTYADIVAGLPRRTYELRPGDTYAAKFKPVLDAVIAIIALVPASIIILLSALVISKDGHSPFYTQPRIGKNGRTFNMLKLRSMVPNADAVLNDYLDANPGARAEWDKTQKLKNDPRITASGRIIRKTSIDELPQLINVVRGEMSLVGPRPMMVEQRALYPGLAYYAMRPGITGFWQTSTRNESSFAERAVFDSAYFRDMSLRTDLRVLVKTVAVVIAGTGY